MVDAADENVEVTWKQVKLHIAADDLAWSKGGALVYGKET
jgi:hypothetical protein